MLIRLTAISLALLTGSFISGCGKQNRYMLAKDKDGIVYRTDRVTGETVMLRGDKLVKVKNEAKKESPAVMKDDCDGPWAKNVHGRGGIEGESIFAGRLYNGNDDFEVTSVTLCIVHKDGEDDCPRLYKYVCNKTPRADGTVEGAPQSSWDFRVKILRKDEPRNHSYSWSVSEIEGFLVQ